LLATVGMDPLTGNMRYTFGLLILEDGFDFLTLGMGLFGIGEIFISLEEKMKAELVTTKLTNLWPTLKDWAVSKWSVVRGSLIGFFVGLLPGGGAVIASLLAYAVEKRVSKEPEKFGSGALEGVASPESANNSAASASFIPMLTLGIPGNPAIAMIFAALLIQGVTPGPLLFKDHPHLFWAVIASMYIGNVMLLVLNLPLVGLWVQMLNPPFDPRPSDRVDLFHRGLQHEERCDRRFHDGDFRGYRVCLAQAAVRAGPSSAGVRPGAHLGEIPAAGSADLPGGHFYFYHQTDFRILAGDRRPDDPRLRNLGHLQPVRTQTRGTR
jgi:Tripartite tricarboxylate transporter TctA family